jgi:hypothetical protein
MEDRKCPVCGDEYEFYEEEVENVNGNAIGVTHNLDQMWEVEESVRWSRICHRVMVKNRTGDTNDSLVIETYRHHSKGEGMGS